jgi:predicted Ser/Thr protein kinase
MAGETLNIGPEDHESSNLDVTTRKCPDCGQHYQGGSHASCVAAPTARRGTSASSKSRLDEIPPEAQLFAGDPARQLNQYILVKQIGKGGMGAVWKAWDRKLTRWLAIKFLIALDEDDVVRFEREAKLAARLRHPNIAPIYEVGEVPATVAGQQTRHYLAMEFIDGESLSAVQISLREAIDLFIKIAQGLEAAHKAGVIHRDIKPHNIMLTSDRWPYIMDFGLAKSIQAESSISVSGSVMGTPAYMPPEQAQGKLEEIDNRSDVYSLGATMYSVFCRRQPFTGHTQVEVLMKVCKDDPEPPRKVNPEIPVAVEQIILKAMAKEKEDRYASAGELAEDLKRYLSDEAITARAFTPVRVEPRKSKAGAWIAILLVLGGGAAAYFGMRGGEEPKPPPPNPAVLPPPTPAVAVDEKAEREKKWRAAWGELRALLDFDDWEAGDGALAGRANEHLAKLAAEAPAFEVDVASWFDTQVDRAANRLQALPAALEERRAQAARVAAWCDTVRSSAMSIAPLSRTVEEAGKVRAGAAKIAAYKGVFTLKILVDPYAQVTGITRDGQPVAFQETSTPAVVGNLEIGNYQIELAHPQLGKKGFKLAADQLKDGKTYVIRGKFETLSWNELP